MRRKIHKHTHTRTQHARHKATNDTRLAYVYGIVQNALNKLLARQFPLLV